MAGFHKDIDVWGTKRWNKDNGVVDVNVDDDDEIAEPVVHTNKTDDLEMNQFR